MEYKDGPDWNVPSDTELHSLYKSGEELTVRTLRFLFDKISALEAIIKKQSEDIQHLKAIISKDSHNSSKPPSSDGYPSFDGYKKKKVVKNLRQKSTKKNGGQEGHPGINLQMSGSGGSGDGGAYKGGSGDGGAYKGQR